MAGYWEGSPIRTRAGNEHSMHWLANKPANIASSDDITGESLLSIKKVKWMRLTTAPPTFPHAQASRMHYCSSCEKTEFPRLLENREGKRKGASAHLFLSEFGHFSILILFDVVQWSRLSQPFPKPERLTPVSVYLDCPTGGLLLDPSHP